MCGIVVATVGMVVMIGWFLDVEMAHADRSWPGHDEVQHRALPGVARRRSRGRNSVTGCAWRRARSVGAIGTVTLAQYVTGWSLGIDEAVLHTDAAADTSTPRSDGGRHRRVPVPRRGRAPRLRARSPPPRDLFGARAAHGRLVGLLGYLFGVRVLYDVGDFSTMAAHTAASMVILAIGLFASTPDGLLAWIVRGDDPGATVLRRILPLALVGVPVVAQVTLHRPTRRVVPDRGRPGVHGGRRLVRRVGGGDAHGPRHQPVARRWRAGERATARAEHEPRGTHRRAHR